MEKSERKRKIRKCYETGFDDEGRDRGSQEMQVILEAGEGTRNEFFPQASRRKAG